MYIGLYRGWENEQKVLKQGDNSVNNNKYVHRNYCGIDD